MSDAEGFESGECAECGHDRTMTSIHEGTRVCILCVAGISGGRDV